MYQGGGKKRGKMGMYPGDGKKRGKVEMLNLFYLSKGIGDNHILFYR